RAPIMGDSYSAARSLWWYGTSTSASTYQDDMSIIARSTNRFGYRADDYGNSITAASALSVVNNQFSVNGVITTTSDVDYFSFSTTGGSASFSLTVPSSVADLDGRLELRNASGTIIASADPSGTLNASLTATLTAGTYYVVVASHGSYGDVGTYQLAGSFN